MKVLEFVELVNRITYKPNYSFNIRDNGDFIHFVAYHKVPDVNKPEEMTTIQFSNTLDYRQIEHMDRNYAIHFIRDTLVKLEMHELDEWLCLDKVQVNNPHPETLAV